MALPLFCRFFCRFAFAASLFAFCSLEVLRLPLGFLRLPRARPVPDHCDSFVHFFDPRAADQRVALLLAQDQPHHRLLAGGVQNFELIRVVPDEVLQLDVLLQRRDLGVRAQDTNDLFRYTDVITEVRACIPTRNTR